MLIRTASHADRDDILRIHLAAFAEEERDIVAKLALDLLEEVTHPPVVSLVAESGDRVVGHVAFSPVAIEGDEHWQGYILAPLGVEPHHQRRTIGSRLIDDGIRRLMQLGVDLLFVYGDPGYYGRFGFSTAAASPYRPPYRLHYPSGWQAIALREGGGVESSAAIRCVASLSDPELW